MEVSRKYFQSFCEMRDSCIRRRGESDMENSRFAVISDSSCDLPDELTAAKEITVVPFYVSFDGETYKKEGTEIGIREFYREMVEQPGVYPKSSMPSIQDYVDVFQPFAQAHIPVLCICITTKFSGSMQSALNAKEMVLSQYEDAQIEVIDATVNTVLQGLFVLEAVSMREEGMTLSEAVAALDEIKESANPHIEILGILLTMVSERTRAVKTAKDMLKEHGLDIKTCEARIRQCEAFKQAELKHISIFDYDPKSNGACDMETFFQEIRPRIEK